MRIPAAIRTLWELPTRLSLRASLLLLLCIMSAIMIQHGVREASHDREEKTAEAQEELAKIASAVAERQTDLVTETWTSLRVLTDLPKANASLYPQCQDIFRRAVAERPWLTSITYFSTEGRALCSSQDQLPTQRVDDRDYFVEALAKRSFVLSDYVISRVTNKPLVVAAVPRTENEEVTAVLVAAIKLDWVNRVSVKTRKPPGTRTLVVDGVGIVLAADPDPGNWVGKNIRDDAQYRTLIGTTDLVAETVDAEGMRWISASHLLPDTRATIIVQQPRATALAGVDRESNSELAGIFAFVAFSFLVVWQGGERLLVRPMRSLIDSAEEIGRGELNSRVATEGMAKDLKILGTAFNRMAAELARHEAELHTATEKLRELAATDGLTGLANRRLFDETYEAEWNRSLRDHKALAVIFIDVDHFKKFNDSYGHIAGDACLRAVATAIADARRRPGDLAGRTGGEEFALLLPGSSEMHAASIAEDLRNRIMALAIEHRDNPAGIATVSIGVAATTPVRGQRATILLERADKALYAAKNGGRNRVVQSHTGLSIAS